MFDLYTHGTESGLGEIVVNMLKSYNMYVRTTTDNQKLSNATAMFQMTLFTYWVTMQAEDVKDKSEMNWRDKLDWSWSKETGNQTHVRDCKHYAHSPVSKQMTGKSMGPALGGARRGNVLNAGNMFQADLIWGRCRVMLNH